ncbi:MAG: non-hydrolyzing UDP-N-acetylglucosamine 2-epimerase [Actinomycetota bacterium]
MPHRTHADGRDGVVPLPLWGRGTERVLFIFGTRPEAIKLAPVIKAVAAEPRLEPVVIVVRQHHEILDQTLDVFGLVADREIELNRNGHGLTELTSRVLERVGAAIVEEAPSIVVVQGDTTTAYASALAAFYSGVPVAHVEAGLRTNNLAHPYPEELNRQMISRIAEMHFAPTGSAHKNLMAEGVPAERVHVTGNTVVDALHSIYRVDDGRSARASSNGVRVLATAHRRENWGAPLAEICRALRDIAEAHTNVEILFVVHPNPIVRRAAEEALGGLENIQVSPPLAYRDFVCEMARANLILTDSGGIQEEAPIFGTPVVVLRETTERIEGLEHGNAIIAGTTRDSIRAAAFAALARGDGKASRERNLYGDGKASDRIVASLLDRFFGEGEEEAGEVSGAVDGAHA